MRNAVLEEYCISHGTIQNTNEILKNLIINKPQQATKSTSGKIKDSSNKRPTSDEVNKQEKSKIFPTNNLIP